MMSDRFYAIRFWALTAVALYAFSWFMAGLLVPDQVEANCPPGQTVQFDRIEVHRNHIWAHEYRYFTCQAPPAPANCDGWNGRCEATP